MALSMDQGSITKFGTVNTSVSTTNIDLDRKFKIYTKFKDIPALTTVGGDSTPVSKESWS